MGVRKQGNKEQYRTRGEGQGQKSLLHDPKVSWQLYWFRSSIITINVQPFRDDFITKDLPAKASLTNLYEETSRTCWPDPYWSYIEFFDEKCEFFKTGRKISRALHEILCQTQLHLLEPNPLRDNLSEKPWRKDRQADINYILVGDVVQGTRSWTPRKTNDSKIPHLHG